MVQSSPPRHTSINIYKYLLSLNVLYNLWIANKKTRVINIVVFEENVNVLSAQITVLHVIYQAWNAIKGKRGDLLVK